LPLSCHISVFIVRQFLPYFCVHSQARDSSVHISSSTNVGNDSKLPHMGRSSFIPASAVGSSLTFA
jgi:hypothetical protein